MEIAAKSSVLLADWIAGFDADNCSVHDLPQDGHAIGHTMKRLMCYSVQMDVMLAAASSLTEKSCRLPQPPMSMQRMDTVRIWMTDIGRRTDTPA